MTSREFVQWRLAALRYFFKASLGYHWHAVVSRELGHNNRLNSLHYHKRWLGKLSTLEKLESVAIRHGFNPAGNLSLLRPVPEPLAMSVSELESKPRRH